MTEIATDTVNVSKGTRTEVFDGKIANAYGLPLTSNKWADGKTPAVELAYIAEYEHVLSYDAIPAKELPDNDDILAVVNQARKANARQKAMQKALDDAGIVKPTIESSDELRLKGIVTSLVASKKYTLETATAAAKTMLGIE